MTKLFRSLKPPPKVSPEKFPGNRDVDRDLVPGRGGVADLGGQQPAISRRPLPVEDAAPAGIEVQVEIDAARVGDAAVEDLELVEDGGTGAAGKQRQNEGGDEAHVTLPGFGCRQRTPPAAVPAGAVSAPGRSPSRWW
ncbi:hypothetical protein [Dankookia sp. P2]|uniref:hypothetical protein n=1 Tax=Dankookia sp. P2 TaxID=3423955 RepID=UPI003D66987B